MRLPRRLSPFLPALLLSLTACDALTGDGWVSETKESGLDGRVITAMKDYTVEGNPTMVRVVLSCSAASKAVTLSLESYEAKATNDQHTGSPLLLTDANSAKGRVVAVALDGSRTEFTLGELFTGGEYNNVVRMDPALVSAAGWFQRDEAAFWRWAAEVAPQRNGAPIDEFAASLKQAASGYGFLAGLQAAAGGLTEGQAMDAMTAQIVPEFVGYAKSKKDLSALAPGAFVRKILPMTVEVHNAAGAFEVTIPADNGVVNGLLDECAGTPWWGNSAASAAPAAPAAEPAETAVADTAGMVDAAAEPEDVEASLRSDLEKVRTAEENIFGERGIYSVALPPGAFTASAGTTVAIDNATETGYVATITHDASGKRCTLTVGSGGGKSGGKEGGKGAGDGVQCQ